MAERARSRKKKPRRAKVLIAVRIDSAGEYVAEGWSGRTRAQLLKSIDESWTVLADRGERVFFVEVDAELPPTPPKARPQVFRAREADHG